MARDLKCESVFQCAFIALFIVVCVQVQALDYGRIHVHSRSHGRKAELISRPFEELSVERSGQRRVAAASTERSRREMQALMDFKAGISAGDRMTFGDWDTDSTPCTWTGVSCSKLHEESHVTELNLPSHHLVGNITSALLALSGLDFLQKLNLSDNNFTRSIPGAALANFSSLAHLDLSYNEVSGELPDQIGEVSNLQSLILAGNSLSGQIPHSISNCTLLKVLNFESNLLVSHIPHVIGRLSHLQELNLGTETPEISFSTLTQRNRILGPIPSSIGNCTSLADLDLNLNPAIGGQIPWELSQLQNLQVLGFYHCGLEGFLPRWIGNLTKLTELHLSDNHFHGPIPSMFGKLPRLSTIEIATNQLTGSIPWGIGNCTSLFAVDVSDNLISGVIPSDLQNCSLLHYLVVGSNHLMTSSDIPLWIGSMSQLEILWLVELNLVGQIPTELGRLSNLGFLRLDANNLHGEIPSSLSNCTFLSQFIVISNNLTGIIPPEVGLLENLNALDVSSNFLRGVVPQSITNLTALYLLSLWSNALSGTLDGQWGLLSQLEIFSANDNHFTGIIPDTLGNCSSLYFISCIQNELTGRIPASFGNLSVLVELDLSQNSLSGKVPSDLGRCSSLSILFLSENKLEGTLPSEFGSLQSLTRLYLGSNRFTGTLAGSLSNLTEIIELDASYNQLSGTVPGKILSRMKALAFIDLSNNLLSGSISGEYWSNLAAVETIVISANNISGSIPNWSKSKNLQYLDISLNNFSGNLPQSLASLPNLAFFNASFNNFVGPIPNFEALKSNLTAASFLGNPGLCGVVLGPFRACPQNASGSDSDGDCEGFRCPKAWVPATVGSIAFILFAAIMLTVCVMRSAAKRTDEFAITVEFGQNLRRLAATEIQAAIGEGENVIGDGPCTTVYKGSLPGCGVVAIKTFPGSNNGMGPRDPGAAKSLQSLVEREAQIQGSLRHRNVLKVLYFCSNLEFSALVLEYMPQGSLEAHLYPNLSVSGYRDTSGQSCRLPWRVRLSIAIDTAEGMMYLHHDCQELLIHGDLKPSNILLSEEMVAKVADFGISKIIDPRRGAEPGEASVSKVCGTFGYMPPEYACEITVSTKGDVYSYGVVLLEMLSGKPPGTVSCESDVDYRTRNLQHFQKNPIDMLDPILRQEGRMDSLKQQQMFLLAKVAFFSTREDPQSRPSMKDIRSMLTQIHDLGVEKADQKTIHELMESEDEFESGFGINS